MTKYLHATQQNPRRLFLTYNEPKQNDSPLHDLFYTERLKPTPRQKTEYRLALTKIYSIVTGEINIYNKHIFLVC